MRHKCGQKRVNATTRDYSSTSKNHDTISFILQKQFTYFAVAGEQAIALSALAHTQCVHAVAAIAIDNHTIYRFRLDGTTHKHTKQKKNNNVANDDDSYLIASTDGCAVYTVHGKCEWNVFARFFEQEIGDSTIKYLPPKSLHDVRTPYSTGTHISQNRKTMASVSMG